MIKYDFIKNKLSNITFIKNIMYPLYEFIYIDNLIKKNNKNNKVLILPVEDYWTINVNLNVKSEKEALKYAKGIFNLDNEYKYFSQKISDNNFILIAFNPNHIFEKYKNIIENKEQLFTFSQFVFFNEKFPILLRNKKVLTTIDYIVAEVDKKYIKNENFIFIDNIVENKKLNLKTFSLKDYFEENLNDKTLKISIFLSSILLLNFLYLNYNLTIDKKENENKLNELLTNNNLPITNIELESVIDNFQNKINNNIKFKNDLFKIRKIKIGGEVLNNSIEFNQKPVSNEVNLPLPPVNVENNTNNEEEFYKLLTGKSSNKKDSNSTNNINNQELSFISKESVKKSGIKELNFDGKTIKLIIETNQINQIKENFISNFNDISANEINKNLEIEIK